MSMNNTSRTMQPHTSKTEYAVRYLTLAMDDIASKARTGRAHEIKDELRALRDVCDDFDYLFRDLTALFFTIEEMHGEIDDDDERYMF